jgi:hypothetical protein
MLCDPPPANEAILPQAREGSYFFNRIGQKQPVENDAIGVKPGQCAGFFVLSIRLLPGTYSVSLPLMFKH